MGIGAEARSLKTGDMYIVPKNVEHYANCGDILAKAQDIFSPVCTEFQYCIRVADKHSPWSHWFLLKWI